MLWPFLENWDDHVDDFLNRQTLQTRAKTDDSGVFDLRLSILEQAHEGLDEVVVSDVLTEGLCELGEVPGEAESDLPGLVLSSIEERTECVHSVLFLAEVGSNLDERLNAEDSDGVLVILGQLSVDGQELLHDVLLLQVGGELSEPGGTGASDHWSVFLAQLQELLAEALLHAVRALVGVGEEGAGGDAADEPLGASESNNERGEDILHLGVGEVGGDGDE